MSIKTAKEDWKVIQECFFSNKSRINLAGRIVLFPLTINITITWLVLELLFGDEPKGEGE